MLVGVDTFPLAWLRTTPFSDYTVPALSAAIVVGGSSLVAAITIVTSRTLRVFAALVAGGLMARRQVPRWIEAAYVGLSLVIVALTAELWQIQGRRHLDHAGYTQYM